MILNLHSSSHANQNPPPKHSHCRRWPRGSMKNVGFLCRRRVQFFLLVSLFYVPGTFMCAGTFFALLRPPCSPPGSVYRSPEVFQKLWPQMQSDNSSVTQLATVWTKGRRVDGWRTCTHSSIGRSGSAAPIGYLIIEANGGLNQQRSSICDAVALAGLLNAVLVIPQFQFHNIWMDPSEFKDIYDEDHFIQMLEGHVKVVRKLPETLMERFDYNISNIPNLRVKARASASYYMTTVYRILHQYGAIHISPFAYRLAMEVPSVIQSLRCLSNYKALRFSVHIETLSRKLVDRMIEKSSKTGGNYVAVHLRFEEDMVAFSCCIYDGGKTEKIEMDSARQRGWREKFNRRGHISSPALNRMNGKCPLTPLEVGMMLRGMGFDNSTSLYLASGKIYKAERNLAPLFQLFPLLQTKESLATPQELSSFQGYSSRLAALDYSICLHSEVFVTTQGGNFPHFMMGHRRYLYGGHAKTIKPDKRKLSVLLQNTNISWKTFKEHMVAILLENDRKGVAARKRKQSIYAYPSPDCTCYQDSSSSTLTQKKSPLELTNSSSKIYM